MSQRFAAVGATVLFVVTLACADRSQNPVSPSGSAVVDTNAGQDGSTLKAQPPTPQSPIGGARLDTMQPTLVIANAAGKFQTVGFAYRFHVLDEAGNVIYDSGTIEQGAGDTSWKVPGSLKVDTVYQWRARAELEDSVGPWSALASFITPKLLEGYVRGNEVYDPLTNGKTVGVVVGSVTFIPGVGVRLNDFGSHIRYELPQTLTTGEFSLLISNMPANTEGTKTKVFAMGQGHEDIVVNDRRMTVEKRGDPPGIIAWRFITRDDQIDTEGAEREFYDFQGNLTYFWKATWNGRFTVSIFEGGVNGRRIYEKGKHYNGVYNPNPHFAYIGAPIGRTGPEGATAPEIIVRQVWISSQPRPDSANQ